LASLLIEFQMKSNKSYPALADDPINITQLKIS